MTILRWVTWICASLLFIGLASATPVVIPLWPEGVPGFRPEAPPERVIDGRFTNVHHATLTQYAPEVTKSTGVAVIVSPGGGYVRVSDGKGEAEWLNSLGITAFVLKYRLNNYGHPAPLQDVMRAIRIVRSRAVEFGLRADRIGVLGGSAGGHLSGVAATLWDSPLGKTGHPLDEISARPDFAALIYPVVTMTDPFVHKGSRQALLGAAPTPADLELLSLEKQVRSNSPPFFIAATMTDTTVPVENSLQLYQALRTVGVKAELHAYGAGSHANSRDPQYGPTARWPERCEEWLRFNNFIPAPERNFARWEKEISALETTLTTNMANHGGVLLLGSSTMRLWKSATQDFPQVRLLNAGFGGSEIADSTHFAGRLVFPVAPRQILFRAGGNDIANGRTPAEVAADFQALVKTIHARLPETEIVFLSWNHSPARWANATREQAMNDLIAAFAQTQPRVKYLDVQDFNLDSAGKPRADLFVKDGIHFNDEGYRRLADRVRPHLHH